ncbi:undecaprenyl/decaprenyl-phosphate alpha-N-acetylglucosaminyl 1-phosphate transferase [Candidatus Pacearchaeota archaeon]|nr:undecaprenyl/decaprenyl-phosphate alpha-N-acetylglucosaminyl 1-phosphate transferase [Candidatus Pacearchaeota archaeon]
MYENLGIYMLIAIVSMVISMVITPLMMRYAAFLGMMDKPDHRKVHVSPIPRVGGVGIVVGLITPVAFWLSADPFVISFLVGCLVLLIFGSWDDSVDLPPIIKFIGQFIAAIVVVYYGDVYVHHFPFSESGDVPVSLAKLFTVFAIVGMINALNLSDGLDGLAGGEALISLLAMGYLSYLFDSYVAMIIVASTIGGVFGFLRFNSHPARVFMGDGGSQSLGFILAVLVVYLSQVVNPIISPVIPLVLLGLPVVDALVVFLIRARRGVSLFYPTKDHLHHRLLCRGFHHYESVVVIYSLQILFVICAISFLYESDVLIFIGYVIACSIVFFGLYYLEDVNWKLGRGISERERAIWQRVKNDAGLMALPRRVLESGVSLFLVAAGFMSSSVPVDFGISAFVLLALLVMFMLGWLGKVVYRLVIFVTVGFCVYLLNEYSPAWVQGQKATIYIYYVVMVFVTFLSSRMLNSRFQATTLDYLVVMLMLVIGFEAGSGLEASLVWLVIQIVILFYACEVVVLSSAGKRSVVLGATITTLLIVALRGIVI